MRAAGADGLAPREGSSRALQGDAVLDRALFGLRWAALAAVLLLGLLDQARGRLGLMTVHLALLIAGYNLLVQVGRARSGGAISYAGLVILDAAVVSVADLLAGQGMSPIFLLYLPVLVGAAVAMRPADSSFLTFAVGLLSLSIAVTQPDWRWGPDQLEFLGIRLVALVLFGVVSTGLSRQLGLQRWSTEMERSAAARLALLNDLLRATSSGLDLGQIMETVAAKTRRGVGSDVALALLLEPDGARPKVWASGDISSEALLRGGDELAKLAARRGRPLHRQKPDLLSEAPTLSRLGLRSLLAAPLEADGQILGILFVGGRAPDAFSPECFDWLLTIAQHAVLPIRNARLQEMERANAARLAEVERAKSSLLSGVSHDLRTPLTSIKVAAGLLTEQRQEVGDASERSLLAALRRNTERLEKLVDEILDVARLQSGAIRLRPEPLDVRGLLREVALSIKPMLDSRGQRLELALPESPVTIWVDRRRLEQVVANLLSNANKYSPDGSDILVAVDEQPDELVVKVADEGPGIPPADRERIFQPFFQSARDRGVGAGVGLGLAIARSLVELHGGRIWLADGGERGTTVAFSLPRQPCAERVSDEGADY